MSNVKFITYRPYIGCFFSHYKEYEPNVNRRDPRPDKINDMKSNLSIVNCQIPFQKVAFSPV